MINRYKNRKVYKNDLEAYKEVFRNRNVKFVNQFSTPKFEFPTAEEMANLNIVKHVWKEGDRYYKLAEKYYGDSRDWWIIAKFNQLPTESHIQVGDIINIPLPLNLILQYMVG
jgi:nucleoid-associated protein YgaU